MIIKCPKCNSIKIYLRTLSETCYAVEEIQESGTVIAGFKDDAFKFEKRMLLWCNDCDWFGRGKDYIADSKFSDYFGAFMAHLSAGKRGKK